MSRARQREIEEAVENGDWKKVYELEHNIQHSETKSLVKGLMIGYTSSLTAVIIGGAAVYFIKKKDGSRD